MSEWTWRLWRLVGFAWRDEGRWIVDMGETTWFRWRHVCGRLYVGDILTGPTRHMGQFWRHSSLRWQWIEDAKNRED